MNEMTTLAIGVYGVRAVVEAPPEVIERVRRVLPPGWTEVSREEATVRFKVTVVDGGLYGIEKDGNAMVASVDSDLAVAALDSQLRAHVATQAADWIFLHAGVVEHLGRAILVPGASFSGKTTLVAELVRAGAVYYSDEYAVLDSNGLIHPYAKPLSIRSGPSGAQQDHAPASLGGSTGAAPIRLGTAVVTHYRPGGVWKPRVLSAGEAVLALLSNTIPAQERPADSLRAIKACIEGAVVLEGERGEASALVPELLGRVAA